MKPSDLKSARKALGLTQRGLALRLGMTGKHAHRTIRRYERRDEDVPARTAVAVELMVVTREMHRFIAEEPVSALHSKKWSMTGVVGSSRDHDPRRGCDELDCNKSAAATANDGFQYCTAHLPDQQV